MGTEVRACPVSGGCFRPWTSPRRPASVPLAVSGRAGAPGRPRSVFGRKMMFGTHARIAALLAVQRGLSDQPTQPLVLDLSAQHVRPATRD